MTETWDVMPVEADPVGRGDWRFVRHRLGMGDGVDLEVFDWQPESSSRPPVVLVPGWLTLVESWRPVVRYMLETRRVVYLETREKHSARIPSYCLRRQSFGLDRFGADLTEVCGELCLGDGSTVFFGSSLGANAILESMAEGTRCHAAFLVGPNAVFDFPLWSYPLLRLPPAAYRALVPVILWILKRTRLDTKNEPEQVARYERSIAAADFKRLKLGALALAGYSAKPLLDRVVDPVAIAYAATDKLHGADAARGLAAALPAGTAIECASNHAMHSLEVVQALDGYIESTVP